MKRDLNQLRPKERALVLRLLEALIHAQTLTELVRTTEDVLIPLTSADCMALCASRLGQPTRDDWLVAKMPEVYFSRYEDWKKYDIIRAANVRHPNRVLRDADILAHKELQGSVVYQIGQDMGVPLERVMSVYLARPGWEGNGGFSVYRLQSRPFSERGRGLIQYIAPYLTAAIQRCQVFVECELTSRMLETQTLEQKTTSLVLNTRCEGVKSVGPMSRLKDKWFSDLDCGPSGLPPALVEKLTAVMRQPRFAGTGTGVWEMEGNGETLRVTFCQLPSVGNEPYWQLRFQELAQPQLLTWLKVLTPKEIQIIHLLCLGLSDKEIAQRLFNKKGENNSPGTVKKHAVQIYKKLKPYGVHNRIDIKDRAHLPSQE